MTDKLPPPVLLTEKQATFVECIGRGMLSKDAYRMAYDTDADDNAVRADASKLKQNPAVALALREVLRSRRIQDLDSVGELMADVKQDQENARGRGADAAVVGFARLRGNFMGLERQSIVFAAESLLSDDELIQRLAGDDPERIAAAKMLLGVAAGFPEGEPIDTEFEEITTHSATHEGK